MIRRRVKIETDADGSANKEPFIFFTSHFSCFLELSDKKHVESSNKCMNQELLFPLSAFVLAYVVIGISMSTTKPGVRMTLPDPAEKITHASINSLKTIFRRADNNGLVD